MDKLLPITLLLLLWNASNAQPKSNSQSSKQAEGDAELSYIFKNDSFYFQSWESGNWLTLQKGFTEYDGNKSTLTIFYQGEDRLKEESRICLLVDTDTTSRLSQIWSLDIGDWQNQSLTETKFQSNELPVLKRVTYWDKETNSWTFHSLTKYKYDNSNKVIELIDSLNDENVIFSGKYIFNYTDSIKTSTIHFFIGSNSKWVESHRDSIRVELGLQNRIESKFSLRSYDGGETYSPFETLTYEYNELGQLLAVNTISKFMDEWITSYRTEKLYNSTGLEIGSIFYMHDGMGLTPIKKNENLVNDLGQSIGNQEYEWDYSSNTWFPTNRNESIIESNKRINTSYLWGLYGPKFDTLGREVYFNGYHFKELSRIADLQIAENDKIKIRFSNYFEYDESIEINFLTSSFKKNVLELAIAGNELEIRAKSQKGSWDSVQLKISIRANSLLAEDVLTIIERSFRVEIIEPLGTTKDHLSEHALYPNPTNSTFSLEGSARFKNQTWHLFDIGGNIVKSGVLIECLFDISDIESGVYFLRFDGTQNQYKIVKLD